MKSAEHQLYELQVQELVNDLTEVLRDHRDKGVPLKTVPSALANICLAYVNGACDTKEDKAKFIAGLLAFLTDNATIESVTRKPDVPVIVKQ